MVRPRRPPEGDGPAGCRGDVAVPVAGGRARGADGAQRHGGGARVHEGVQPLDRRRLGLRVPGPDLRRAVHRAVRRGEPRRRVAVVHRARRPRRHVAPRPGGHERRHPLAGRPDVRPVLGPRPGGRGRRGAARRVGDDLLRAVGRPQPALGRRTGTEWRRGAGVDAHDRRHAAGRTQQGAARPRLLLLPHRAPALRALPPPPRRHHRERRRVGAATAAGARVPRPRRASTT